MTRVLGLVTEAYGGRGGIAQATRDMVDAFAGHTATTQIDLLVRLAPDPTDGMPPKVEQAPAIQSRIRYALRAIASVSRKPDLIYCNHLYMAPLARLISRLTGARLIIQLHGIEVWGRVKPQLRHALEAADMLVCVSRDTRRRALAQACIAPERAVVVNNTVSDRFQPGDRQAARRKFGIGDEFVLLTVGRLSSQEQYKGHDRVLRALPSLKPSDGRSLRYLIAGDGDDLPRLRQMAHDLGCVDKVNFLGHVKHDDLPDLYRSADVFVMPSEGEGFGIAFLEAMSSGTPSVGLAVGGAPDALGDGELGRCVAGTGFSDALNQQIATPPGSAIELARLVQDRFGRSAFRAQTAAALDRLCGRPFAEGTP
jgi:phosphatidyl-myo-inositol dimannoside synthase